MLKKMVKHVVGSLLFRSARRFQAAGGMKTGDPAFKSLIAFPRWSGIVFLMAASLASEMKAADAVVVAAPDAPPLVRLAAREVARYVYLRTGERLAVADTVPSGSDAIRLRRDPQLAAESYRLKSGDAAGGGKVIDLTGGSDVAVLYAAYQFAESLGVRFYLHGDVLPDKRMAFVLPDLDETHTPLFEKRGLLPFHDFTQGPDWWEADDYKACFTQMVKMRMNVMGLHCYPEGPAGPEPLVWIGHPDDVDGSGKVSFSSPSFWASTRGGAWGYADVPTRDFAAGAGLLFEEDDFGPSVTRGHRPKPTTVAASNEVFGRASALLSDAFGYGRGLGVKIALGTETPLHIPQSVEARLREKGLDPTSQETRQAVYEGMFTRIARAYPIDYYWLWTPESWTWGAGASQPQIDAVVADIKTALAAHEKVGKPFGFGTNGWELGPKQDRGLFNSLLPKDAVMSCINRNIGFNWVDQEFLRIQGRPKWAIPWLEDDSAMVLPQLWAGRVRRDAADAHAYGCTGLLGIHWRTKILAPNVSALAKAGWSQQGWNPDAGKRAMVPEIPRGDVWHGGQTARSEVPVEKTDEDRIYQEVRFGMSSCRITVPNGRYRVTLKFCEIAYDAPGKRVFGVDVAGRKLVDRLDLVAVAGKNKAHDLTSAEVRVIDEELKIDFKAITENPVVSAIVIDGVTDDFNQFKSRPYTRRINCGGGKWESYEADLAPAGEMPPMPPRTRDLPCADLYQDMAGAWFGPEIAREMADFLTRYDGDGGALGVVQGRATLPRPNTWLYGPGAIVASREPWEQAVKRYAFVDELAALRGRINSPGDLDRFDNWLNHFRYLRAVDEAACTRGALDAAMDSLKAENDPAGKTELARTTALPARIRLARAWENMMSLLLHTADTPGCLGTIANLEQSTRAGLKFVDGHDAELVRALGKDLPPSAVVSTRYQGKARIIVPTQRTVMAAGERSKLKVIFLDRRPPEAAELRWRPLGKGDFRSIPLRHVARGVHEVDLPQVPAQGAEYHVHVKTAGGESVFWPATAPTLNHVLTQMPSAPN